MIFIEALALIFGILLFGVICGIMCCASFHLARKAWYEKSRLVIGVYSILLIFCIFWAYITSFNVWFMLARLFEL